MSFAKSDSDLASVAARLREALEERQGRIRVVDALVLAGFERRNQFRARLVGRAMRQLGWGRARYRFDGSKLEYAYARGTGIERDEVILELHRDDRGQISVIERRL